MGDIKDFLKIKRQPAQYRPVCERVRDYMEVMLLPKVQDSKEQASRCMDCGTPFCNWACPLGNYIPEWNDFMSSGNWKYAIELLNATNSFPEWTGRICPAPCEFSCVLGVNDEPVTIKENELAIIEYAFKHGFIKPCAPKVRSGKKVAIIGSGPAGLSCADQLNKAGHNVTVFEGDDKIGGILRYGIPDFKLEKWIIDRRLKILEDEGIEFITGVNVDNIVIVRNYSSLRAEGEAISSFSISGKEFDAVCLAGGCRVPRDLKIEGKQLDGIHFAMDYLVQSNKIVTHSSLRQIDAKEKQVVVIGGGDTGADCIGVAHRQQAKCVVQIEILPKPPQSRPPEMPWPGYPMILKNSTSHEEGGMREWSVLTKNFIGENGKIKKISCVRVDFSTKDPRGYPVMKEIPGTEFEIPADLVILALGFIKPEHSGLLEKIGVEYDSRGNVQTDENFMTSVKGIFCAGDMHTGQSLIVRAINEGQKAAHFINQLLNKY